MRGKIRLSLLFVVFLAAVLPGCQQTINYPAPAISAISPTSIQAGQPLFTLTVTGSNFTPASTILWNGGGLSSIFVNTNTLTALVSASLIENPGTANIEVSTPTPGGGLTLAVTFTINPTVSPTPSISSTSPSSVLAGSAALTLTVLGTNFVPLSVVNVGNTPLQTTYEGPTFLKATLPGSNLATAGSLQITVVNPANPSPGGGSSNPYSFNINNPVPSITAVSPAAIAAGGTGTTLSITGSGFAANSEILVNGVAYMTVATYTTAVANLNSGDLSVGGIDLIQVFNPGPGGGTSNTLTLAVDPIDTAGLPILVDYAPDGTQANSGICGGLLSCQNGSLGLTLTTSGPSSSSTGEFVAFASISSNLVVNQSSAASQIFVRDTCLGQSCTPLTFLASVAYSGVAANGANSEPSMDSSGGSIVYTSLATNLVDYVPVNGGTRQLYWQPVCRPISAGSSSNGSVATCTTATTTTTSNGSSTTPTNQIVLVSVGADGSAGNGDSYNPVLSPDGQFVAFVSLATNLVSGATVDGVTPQVYLRTLCGGVTPLTETPTTTTTTTTSGCAPTTYLVSSPEGITPGNGPSSHPAISSGGTYVSFVSSAGNLVGGQNPPLANPQIFEQYECQLTGTGCVPAMAIISSPDGTTPAGGINSQPAISYDGRFVAFSSTATNLGVASGGIQQIYVRDTCTNASATTTAACVPSTRLVSTPDGTTPGNGLSESASINQDSTGSGQLIAFASLAPNLSANAANGIENIYVRNTCNTIVSSSSACAPGTALVSQAAGTSPPASNGSSYAPSISADGHTVSFLSFASDLVAHDSNGLEDVFLSSTTF
ncbi:MAG: hypothetical protein ABSA57_10590 [Candidatus Acidiferrales bacterium]